MSEPAERRSEQVAASITAGFLMGIVEVVLASSFAALIFSGRLSDRLPDGVGLNLGAVAVLVGMIAWSAGPRGVVASGHDRTPDRVPDGSSP